MIITEHIATHYAADFDLNRLSLVQVQSLCPVTSCNMRMSTDAYYDVSIVSQFADIVFEVAEVDIHGGTSIFGARKKKHTSLIKNIP